MNSARMKHVLYDLPKARVKIHIAPLTLPPVEKEETKEGINDLEGEGIKKIIIPSNIKGNFTRLEVLLRLKLSGLTDSLTTAGDLMDKLYKRGEIQNDQQYRNALDNFHTF